MICSSFGRKIVNIFSFSSILIYLVKTISLKIDKCKPKNAASVSKVLALLALLSWSSEGYIKITR